MTGSASNLTLKLVLHHDELKNVNHVVLGALVEVSGIQILFHWTGLKKLVQKACVTKPEKPKIVHYLLRYQGRGEVAPAYIRQKKANQDRVKDRIRSMLHL